MKQALSVRLSEDLRRDLQQISDAEAKPLSDLVRESIQRYVALYKFRRLRRAILPFAEAQGFLTDEDVFKRLS